MGLMILVRGSQKRREGRPESSGGCALRTRGLEQARARLRLQVKDHMLEVGSHGGLEWMSICLHSIVPAACQ